MYRCPRFHKVKAEFVEAAALLSSADSTVVLGKVDCAGAGDVVGGKETCKELGVDVYPTVKIFRNGEETSDYEGSHEAGGIVAYMRSVESPASVEVASVGEYEELSKNVSNIVMVFGYQRLSSCSLFSNVKYI